MTKLDQLRALYITHVDAQHAWERRLQAEKAKVADRLLELLGNPPPWVTDPSKSVKNTTPYVQVSDIADCPGVDGYLPFSVTVWVDFREGAYPKTGMIAHLSVHWARNGPIFSWWRIEEQCPEDDISYESADQAAEAIISSIEQALSFNPLESEVKKQNNTRIGFIC